MAFGMSPLAAIIVGAILALSSTAVVADEANADRFRGIGVASVIDVSDPPGLDLCAYVLSEPGIERHEVLKWNEHLRSSSLEASQSTESSDM